jgi:CRP-like cAMP-binding protein
MEQIKNILASCPLFSNLGLAARGEIGLGRGVSIRQYARDQVVAFEEDNCNHLGIVASGSIHIQRIFPSGKTITLETFDAGDSFGEALIFSDTGTYPATLIASDETSVLFIPRETIVDLCTRYPDFLREFIRTLSNRILLLNNKIKSLTMGTVRQKVAHFLIEEYQRQGNNLLAMTQTRHALADSLGIPRPSLSRELISMKDEGWIDFNRQTITLQNPSALEAALRE